MGARLVEDSCLMLKKKKNNRLYCVVNNVVCVLFVE
jgi:hypothetical protein